MPLLKSLRCFADPVEYLWGEFDQPFYHYTASGERDEKPWGCAGCKVKPACGTVAIHRVESDDELRVLHETWQKTTKSLSREDRYKHPSWGSFRKACAARTWTNSNDLALEQEKQRAASRAKQRRKARRKQKNRPRSIPDAILAEIEAEHNRRLAALISAKRAPNAPLYIRNLPDERCELTADVWQAEEVLSRSNRRVSGSSIAEWLTKQGKDYGIREGSLRVRVNDAVKRVTKLEQEPEDDPVWSEFTLQTPVQLSAK